MNNTTETTTTAAAVTTAFDIAAVANEINTANNRGGKARVIIRTLADNLRDNVGRDMRLLYVNGGVYTGKANDRARVRVWLRQLPEMPATGATWELGGVMAWDDIRVSDALRGMIADCDKPAEGASAYFVTIIKA